LRYFNAFYLKIIYVKESSKVKMGVLSNELPVINIIKSRMKTDDKFTKDQIRDFERRVGRTHSLRFLVEMVQEFQQRYVKLSQLCGRESRRADDLQAKCDEHEQARNKMDDLRAKCEEYERARQRLIEEFGNKSYEYGIYSGDITPDEANETNEINETKETNETNRSCQLTKEPLEVIDLDEIYKKQEVEIKTNG